MKKTVILIALCALLVTSCKKESISADYQVVPLPQGIAYIDDESFQLDSKTVITYPADNEILERSAQFLAGYIQEFTGMDLSVLPGHQGKSIKIETRLPNDNKDAYELTVSGKEIIINGASDAGTFYGIQTLRKSIPVNSINKTVSFPAARITDYPRFSYRGMHLDVGRHMFPVAFIKKYIDLLALHNVNYFHWHLSDDQGWRIEIKKYPELTEIASIRKETLVGHLLNDVPHVYDGKPYGGYYTQDEIREIVKYAQDRFVTIIPEIDMPGHMLAALTVYPELGCTGGPYEVATKWGVFPDVLCAGNPRTYEFLENVFTEVAELFPSEYIHIGGDECPKTHWKACPKCQEMIRKQGIKGDSEHSAETKLQGYMVNYVEEILREKGREIIGWDEILEGDQISENAIIHSWRGNEGGIAAAKKHRKAIMSPHYNLYLDYNQGEDISKEPLSIGEYISVRKVYDYEPVPDELTADEAKYIIGPQGNLWTEYIETPAHVEYMLLPRLAALSEVQWVLPSNKDYPSFLHRMDNMLNIYKKNECNYAKHIYGISADVRPTKNKDGTLLSLLTAGTGQIFYTTDGTIPTRESSLYTTSLRFSSPVELKAIAVHPDTVSGIFEYKSNFNKASYKPVQLLSNMNPRYVFSGPSGLVDGKTGAASYVDGNWVGFSGKRGMEAVIDLGKTEEISSVKAGMLDDTPNWIFRASAIKIYGSDDNRDYTLIAEKGIEPPTQSTPIQRLPVNIEFSPVNVRYMKIALPGIIIPAWHEGNGTSGLIFIDEIEIN